MPHGGRVGRFQENALGRLILRCKNEATIGVSDRGSDCPDLTRPARRGGWRPRRNSAGSSLVYREDSKDFFLLCTFIVDRQSVTNHGSGRHHHRNHKSRPLLPKSVPAIGRLCLEHHCASKKILVLLQVRALFFVAAMARWSRPTLQEGWPSIARRSKTIDNDLEAHCDNFGFDSCCRCRDWTALARVICDGDESTGEHGKSESKGPPCRLDACPRIAGLFGYYF